MTDAQALLSQALALEDAGRPEEALACYREILAQHPRHADARHNLGLLLARLRRLEEAESSHLEYARLHPDSARPWNNVADVRLARGNYEGAIEALERIPEQHREATALVRRGVALSCLRRFEEAHNAFRTARSRDSDGVQSFARRIARGADIETLLSPENIYLARRYMAQGECDWSGWSHYVAEARRAAVKAEVVLDPAVAFMAFHLPLTGEERHGIARRIADRIEATVKPLSPPGARARTRIRVGVLSPDFREHLIAYLLLPLFELSDRARFEVYAYSLSPDDGSVVRPRVRAAADAFRDLHRMSDDDAALTIRRDDIDILLDVAGHTTGGRFGIMARRPARVQVSYLGFPGSLGSRRVDFAIVDRVVASEGPEWSESLIYLPHTYFLYDFREPVPEAPVVRRDYGLPDNAFVYCAFHKAEKITPDTFDLWMRILRRVPHSVLWFRALSHNAARNLRLQAGARGVDPARLVFAPFEPRTDRSYLARQRLGDLLLDALHHNAITNACDALAAGLPILSVRGSSMASRAGESLLRAAGMTELACADTDAFVESAVQLGSEPELLRRHRETLQSNRWKAPLFDTAGRIRELEEGFTRMVHGGG